MESMEPCPGDCFGQNYPSYPYDDGDEQLFSKVLPIVLSAMVVVISWLAGRFIDKIDISTQGSMNRVKLGTVTQSVKRSASHDKAADFHSSARGGSVQELDRLSIADDEGRLYNEHYGSEHSQEDGDRYDALGDSPGAPGPSRHPPRSPSVYSQFSQSVFSQSAYGPSAYGPSQRRLTGSVYGHSQYDNASSQGSQYPGPVPSHFGASQLSENTSYHATGSAGSHQPGGAFVQGNIPATYGGDMGRGAGMAQRLPPPTYNPYASRQGGGRVAAGRGVGIVGMRGGMASGQGLAVTQEGVAVSGFNRGSPPPYSQAQMAQAHAQAQAHHAPVMVLPNDPRLSQQQGIAASLAGVPGAGPGVTHQTASLVAPPPALMAHTSGLPPAVPAVHPSVSIANPSVSVVSPAEHPVGVVSGTTGPKSGFGSDSDDGAASEVPSAFRP